jgi:hypothetical protein
MVPYPALDQLFAFDGFLNQIERAGLALILSKLQELNPYLNPDSRSKEEWIRSVLSYCSGHPIDIDTATRLLDHTSLMIYMSKTALELIARSFGHRTTGTMDELQRYVSCHLPITINVTDDFGQVPITINRCSSIYEVYAKISFSRNMLTVPNHFGGMEDVYLEAVNMSLFRGLKHGSNVQFELRSQFRAPPPPPVLVGGSSSSGYNNSTLTDDDLIAFLLDKAGVEVDEPVIIMVKDPITKVEFIVEAFLCTTIRTVTRPSSKVFYFYYQNI